VRCAAGAVASIALASTVPSASRRVATDRRAGCRGEREAIGCPLLLVVVRVLGEIRAKPRRHCSPIGGQVDRGRHVVRCRRDGQPVGAAQDRTADTWPMRHDAPDEIRARGREHGALDCDR